MLLLRTRRSAKAATLARNQSSLLLALMALVVAIGLAACGSEEASSSWRLAQQTGPKGDAAWQQLIKKAKAEGEVVFYTAHADETMTQLAEAFEREYGIEVELFRGADSDLEPKLDAEAKTGNHVADLVGMSDQAYLESMAARGGFAEPVGPALDAPAFDREANSLTPEVMRSVMTTMSYAWNTDLHPKGLSDFDDLLDPSLAGGKIGVLAPFTPAVMDFYVYLEKHYGADYLERLAQQEPRIYQAGEALAEALAAGEIAAGTQVSQVALYEAQKAGAPVDGGLASPAWGAALYDAVLADAPHPNAAQLLMNYIFTPAGQEIMANRTASVLPGIPGTATTVEKTTTGGVMNAPAEKFNAFVEKFTTMFQ